MKSLRIVCFNAGLFYINLFGKKICEWPKYSSKRLEKMPEMILALDVDVICLQEVWKKNQREYLAEELGSDFPYMFTSETKHFSRHSGLMVFSKYPLKKHFFHCFSSNTFDELLFTEKGFSHIEIDHPSLGRVAICNTHLVAGGAFEVQDSRRIIGLRQKQLEEIFHNYEPLKIPLILMGDMNFCTTVAFKNYSFVLKQGFVDSFDVSLKEVSWDPKNELNTSGPYSSNPAQKPDHIFYKGFPDKIEVKTQIILTEEIVELENKSVSLSDHFALFCEFHLI